MSQFLLLSEKHPYSMLPPPLNLVPSFLYATIYTYLLCKGVINEIKDGQYNGHLLKQSLDNVQLYSSCGFVSNVVIA